ncbi:hypothetical protein ColLi_03126 [Colletotrichum liriopes]|uniref:Uncharacterized protein n=1 Tax=Colletotrichum liriopes TaxID=708192 RepID=A0AA37GH91_9PEZI|nr:hypothetical protein ColLi_03126 [Colletotrichum liriopes]
MVIGTLITAASPVESKRTIAKSPNYPFRAVTKNEQKVIFDDLVYAFYQERNATKTLLGRMSEDPSTVSATIIHKAVDNYSNIACFHLHGCSYSPLSQL